LLVQLIEPAFAPCEPVQFILDVSIDGMVGAVTVGMLVSLIIFWISA
jgi:hypothetical protein